MKKILSALLRALLVCGIATGCVKGSENGGGGFFQSKSTIRKGANAHEGQKSRFQAL